VIAPKAPSLKDASSHLALMGHVTPGFASARWSGFFCRRRARKATRVRTNLCDRERPGAMFI
jgi:hypothetical protein